MLKGKFLKFVNGRIATNIDSSGHNEHPKQAMIHQQKYHLKLVKSFTVLLAHMCKCFRPTGRQQIFGLKICRSLARQHSIKPLATALALSWWVQLVTLDLTLLDALAILLSSDPRFPEWWKPTLRLTELHFCSQCQVSYSYVLTKHCVLGQEPWSCGYWMITHNQEVVSSNPGTIYWMYIFHIKLF